VRLQAVELLELQLPTGEIAARLRVSPKSVRAWRRAWIAGGSPALASRGPGGAVCKLTDAHALEFRSLLAGRDWCQGWRLGPA
jgi:putative transposase